MKFIRAVHLRIACRRFEYYDRLASAEQVKGRYEYSYLLRSIADRWQRRVHDLLTHI